MSDQNLPASQIGDADSDTKLPPPTGDPEKAEKYVNQLIELVNEDKLLVSHTDLSKFDPTSLQDHYRLDLKDYNVEVSHNKQPDSGKDFYVMLFNNLKYVNEKCTEKVILAYMHLSDEQFIKFKAVANNQIERKRREVEEKKLKAAMAPIDQALEQVSNQNSTNNLHDPPLDNIPSSSIFQLPSLKTVSVP